MNTPAWQDFNDANAQNSYDVIPKGTIAPVRMTIKPGGFDNHNFGWTGGYATQGDTGAVYLNCEFVVTQGEFAKRKAWSLIGLHSPKGPEWGNMGRSFIRAILNSACNISDKDNSPHAMQCRRIRGFSDLDGIEFLAKFDVEKDQNDEPKNVIKFAITPDHKEYFAFQSGAVAPVAQTGFNPTNGAASANNFQAPAGYQPQMQQATTFHSQAQQNFQQQQSINHQNQPQQQQSAVFHPQQAQQFQQNTNQFQQQQIQAPVQQQQNQYQAPAQNNQAQGGMNRPKWAQ